MSVDRLKKHLRKTGLVSVSGLKKRELENLKFKVGQYRTSLSLSDPSRYSKIKFGKKKPIRLTDDQQAIVTADTESHYKIIACAGSGKTTTIICRIKYLIDSGVKPWQIMLTTFNVDAAENMRTRLKELFGFKLNIYCGTIDALAYRFYNAYFKRPDFIGVSEYCTEFLKFLKSDTESSDKLRNKFKYVFFDEFQDCNDVQYEIVKILAKKSWVSVIGDDAQNIYQWRGSNMDFILRFEDYLPMHEITNINIENQLQSDQDDVVDDLSDYSEELFDEMLSAESIESVVTIDNIEVPCKVMTLIKNFRSTPEIVKLANKSIENNSDQIPKQMVAVNKSYDRLPRLNVYTSGDEEAAYTVEYIKRYIYEGKIKPEEIAVLARNNYSIKKVEELLEINNAKMRNPFKVNYVALITDDTRDTKPKILKGHVTLTTIHKSKGLEWDVVFVMSCNDDKFPSETTPIKLQEDRRLFYVAVTRAKRYLNLSFIRNKSVTRFIGELDKSLYRFDDTEDRYFKYSDDRNIKFKNGVTQLIEMLEPRDIKTLREFGFLPEINPITRSVHSSHKYSDYIGTYYLQADYGIYIDRYISRQLGIMVPGSGGLSDSTANRVLHTLKLDKTFYSLYMKYNYNIQRKIDIIKQLCAKSHSGDSVRFLTPVHSDPPYIKDIDDKDRIGLSQLIHMILNKAEEINCQPSQVFITTVSHLPHAFYQEYYDSYERFQSRVSGQIILKDVYRVSLCQNVYDGRRRLLYKDCFDEFNTDLDLYNDINNWCASYANQNLKTKATYIDTDLSICGELDAIILTEYGERIIDFKCSLTSECKLEWVIQLLMYCALHKKKTGQSINRLSIYNPLRGTMTDINIGDWDMHEELLTFMDGIRTERMQQK
jgi:UvrD-like helicase C-terminal domain/UvrD/REP helicase N-terminal domain